MAYHTRKQAIIKMREAIKENEGREYSPAYISWLMRQEDNKWIITTKRGNRYELDA